MGATDTDIATAASETLRRYRTDHRIRVRTHTDGYERCVTDGIRVWPVKGGRMRHDPTDIVKLMANAYGGPERSIEEAIDAAAVEVARDVIREELPLDRAPISWGNAR